MFENSKIIFLQNNFKFQSIRDIRTHNKYHTNIFIKKDL